MPNRILGKDLEVSAVGLGCMGFTHAYGMEMIYETKEELELVEYHANACVWFSGAL